LKLKIGSTSNTRNNCELSLRIFDALSRTKKPFMFTTSQLAGYLMHTAHQADGLALGGASGRESGAALECLWGEHPDSRSHVITDLVLSGLRGRVTCMTSGEEKRLFLYKTDAVAALLELFDGPLQTAEIAGPQWLRIREVADEVARQLNVAMTVGQVRVRSTNRSDRVTSRLHARSFAEELQRLSPDARNIAKNQSAAVASRPSKLNNQMSFKWLKRPSSGSSPRTSQ